MADRNPSPPPGIREDPAELKCGQIGDTLFSQHWLFQVLLKAIEYTEQDESQPTDGCNDSESIADVHELPKDLEDTMCTLWDMSADSDVAHFLVDFKAKSIFLGIIEKTKSPRLLEIITGILGNMAFYEDICEHFTESPEFVQQVLQLLGTTDTPTLIQIMRLVHVCIASPKAGDLWTDTLREQSSHLNHLLFVLENSLNGELLTSTLRFLYCLVDKHFEVLAQWNSGAFVQALVTSASQLVSLDDCESIVEYWHVLHLLSRLEGYLQAIASQEAVISQHLCFYISQFIQNEDPVPPRHHVTGVAAAFALVNILSSLEIPEAGSLAILKDASIVQYVKNLHKCLQSKTVQMEDDSPDPSTWELLFEVLRDTMNAIDALKQQPTAKLGERQR